MENRRVKVHPAVFLYVAYVAKDTCTSLETLQNNNQNDKKRRNNYFEIVIYVKINVPTVEGHPFIQNQQNLRSLTNAVTNRRHC